MPDIQLPDLSHLLDPLGKLTDPMPPIPTPLVVPEVPGGAGGVQVNPDTGAIESTSPDTPAGHPSDTSSPTVTSGGTAPFNTDVLKWLGALVLLWIVLTALTEYSPNTQIFGQALAGLILLGALYYMGPQAIANVGNVWGKK